ncbi:MAG: response regulator transcription factor [Verrucomicrobiota bacterium]
MHNDPVTVAFVEDTSALRGELQNVFAGVGHIRCVAACANGEQALEQLPMLKPQVVFMDINLPGMDGTECVRQLVERSPGVLVVMLTILDNADAIFDSLAAGACGYLHKPVRSKDLVGAVRDVMAGGSPMSGRIARMVVQFFLKRSAPRHAEKPMVELTTREQAVLDLLKDGHSYKEIADKLAISGHTVHFHIRNVYGKLQVRSRGEAVAKMLKR